MPRRRALGISVWLIQLTIPAAGLLYVGMKVCAGVPLGRYSLSVLGFCLAWYAVCLGPVCIQRFRVWLRAKALHLTAMYLGILGGLLLAEGLCRALGVRDGEGVPDTRYCRELGWRLVSGTAGVGEHGWRGPAYPPEPAGKCFRIVALGDSTTFGLGCLWDAAWPHQLEALLNQDAAWKGEHGTTQAINLGVLAYGPDQALLALRKYGLAYEPNIVILHLCTNDFADVSFDHDWRMAGGVTRFKPCYTLQEGRLVMKRSDAPQPRRNRKKSRSLRRIRSWVSWSALFTRLYEALPILPTAGLDHLPVHEGHHSAYTQARPLLWAIVREIALASRRAGAAFLVSLSPTHIAAPGDDPPWRFGSFLREVREDASASGVPFLDCVQEYFALGGGKAFALRRDSRHLSEQGNALVARMTMRWLREHYHTVAPGSEH